MDTKQLVNITGQMAEAGKQIARVADNVGESDQDIEYIQRNLGRLRGAIDLLIEMQCQLDDLYEPSK